MKKFISQCVVAALCLFVVSCSGGGGNSSKAFGDGCISNEEIAKLLSKSPWYGGLKSEATIPKTESMYYGNYESRDYKHYELWKEAGLVTYSAPEEWKITNCQLTDKGKQYLIKEDEYGFTVHLGKPVFEVYYQVCTVDKERNTTKAVVKVIADLEERTPFVTEKHHPRTAWLIDYFWKNNTENIWTIYKAGGGEDEIKQIKLPQGK